MSGGTDAVLVVHVVDLVDPQTLPLVQLLLLEDTRHTGVRKEQQEQQLTAGPRITTSISLIIPTHSLSITFEMTHSISV